MGRQLRRVPLDFSWPLNKPYEGFLNNLPYGDACTDCKTSSGGLDHSSGYSPYAQDLYGKWYGFNGEYDPVVDGKVPFTWDHPAVLTYARSQVVRAPDYYGATTDEKVRANAERLAIHFNSGMAHFLEQEDVNALCEAGRLHDFTHDWTPRVEDGNGGWTGGWVEKVPKFIPTAEQVNNWSIGGMGHDSINQWVVIDDRCKRAGVSATCVTCGGGGVLWASKEAEEAYDAWESTEPPEGPGWQLWETVSEGSPITPVFATAEELARYLSKSTYADGLTYEGWMKFILGDGWSMSMMIKQNSNGENLFLTGAQSAVHEDGMDTRTLESLFSDVDQ